MLQFFYIVDNSSVTSFSLPSFSTLPRGGKVEISIRYWGWPTSTFDERPVEACRSEREDSQLPQTGITLSSHAKDSPVSGSLNRMALELSLSTIRKEAASLEDDLLLYLLDMTIRHLKKKSVTSSDQFVKLQEQIPIKFYPNSRRRSNFVRSTGLKMSTQDIVRPTFPAASSGGKSRPGS